MSEAQRRALYDNAKRIGSSEALAVVNLILENDLLVTDGGGLARDHPVIQQIEAIARSPEGRAAAKAASDTGLPALAGVDPLLKSALGPAYGSFDTTSWAGGFVVEEMESQGYRQAGRRPMPTDCIAKTAAFFVTR
jgi:hypothetical protein